MITHVYDKCIRIDAEDGTVEDCSINHAYRQIEECYKPSQPAKDQLHNGEPIRTTFAIYQVVRATSN